MIRVKIERQPEEIRGRGWNTPAHEAATSFRVEDIPGWQEPLDHGELVSAGGRALERRDPTSWPDPPTKKQLDYLYALGYVGMPPKTRASASQLIDAEKAKVEEEKRREWRQNLRMDL